jgi:hypothetical protein
MGEGASELENPSSDGEHNKEEIFSPYLRLILQFNLICINDVGDSEAQAFNQPASYRLKPAALSTGLK